MSAIEHVPQPFGGVPQYKSRCKVLLDSHMNKDTTTRVIVDEVVAVSLSKTVKGVGQCSITLLPSTNWLNIVFPNDHINIYFDIGDGSGWTRTFYGLVDRIEESYSVSDVGVPSSNYTIVCSDFQKMVDKTQIYFNPHVVGRDDFASTDFGRANIGGLALASSGMKVGGSPPDIIQNVLLTTYGFGSQFVLPSSYAPRSMAGLRQLRRDLALKSASPTLQELAKQGNLNEVIDAGNALVRDPSTTEAQRQEALAAFAPAGADAGQTAGDFSFTSFTILASTRSAVTFMLDIIDIFSFVERESIDGYIAGAPVWQKTGSVLSLIRELSNELANETFLDLRPLSVADATHIGLVEDDEESSSRQNTVYARVADDKSGNVDIKSAQTGITYSPSLIMREYPFSTIGYVNSNVYGHLYIGNIFCTSPNQPGRHVVAAPNINITDISLGLANSQPPPETIDIRPADALRKLDVAVISQTEIISSNLGRSDEDHFNLFEIRSDDLLGSVAPLYMQEFLPIITPIQIKRNGLRTHELNTYFARTSSPAQSRAVEGHTTPAPSDNEPAQEGYERPVVIAGDLTAPVLRSTGGRFSNTGSQRWGYRQKPRLDNIWMMHHGVDIGAGGEPSPALWKSIPVYAIADGEVVISAPEGCFAGYGDCIVIKHSFDGQPKPVYSTYNHLSQRLVGWQLEKEAGTRSERGTYAAVGAPGVARPTQTSIPVRKGTIIGMMGNTGMPHDSARKRTNDPDTGPRSRYSGIHLHFEIDFNFPPINKTLCPDVESTQTTRPEPPAGFKRSIDPVGFFADNGINLVAAIMETGNFSQTVEEAQEDSDPSPDEPGADGSDEDDNSPREDQGVAEAPTPSPTGASVDYIRNAPIRRQILRWTLLQDHWYQHNHEYLSGKIDMRGAPEIRVGYRLDLVERGLSFYVEGVNHRWQFPDRLQTSLTVTRGQPNNPFPMYVVPKIPDLQPTEGQRKLDTSRLASSFETPDLRATSAGVLVSTSEFAVPSQTNGYFQDTPYGNETDMQAIDDDGIVFGYEEKAYYARDEDELEAERADNIITNKINSTVADISVIAKEEVVVENTTPTKIL